MKRRRTTNRIKLPEQHIPDGSNQKKLPYNGNAVTEKSFVFSFASFDRKTQELFNLGDNTPDGVVSGRWFISFIDCLKEVCNMNISELRHTMYDFHPVDWANANVTAPDGYKQLEYWQLRVNKSRGRIIGIKIDNVFYIVWLDPHHNFSDSEGYGGIKIYRAPESEYEARERQLREAQNQIEYLEGELRTAEELLEQAAPHHTAHRNALASGNFLQSAHIACAQFKVLLRRAHGLAYQHSV